MSIPVILFWISLAVLFFCYAGYGILLIAINAVRQLLSPKPILQQAPESAVTLIIPSYNEGPVIKQKIQNCLNLAYPSEKLTILFVTDGSSDNTSSIISTYPRINEAFETTRKGKMAAIKHAMKKVQTPLVIFTDANSFLNPEAIKRIIRHYGDPRVGGVAGEKKILAQSFPSAVGEAEGLYWKYESYLKKLDADFHSVVGAAGELFSIRTELFPELDDNIILDDFMISMKICLRGYTIAYEPGAFASEHPSSSMREEEKRKIRITAGVYQSIGLLKDAMNLFRHPLLAFQYLSRRLLRWIVCPILLPVLLVANAWIVMRGDGTALYPGFFFLQSAFYLSALAGWLIIRLGKRASLLTIPFYFVFMNICLVKGFVRWSRGTQPVIWEKSTREVPGQTI